MGIRCNIIYIYILIYNIIYCKPPSASNLKGFFGSRVTFSKSTPLDSAVLPKGIPGTLGTRRKEAFRTLTELKAAPTAFLTVMGSWWRRSEFFRPQYWCPVYEGIFFWKPSYQLHFSTNFDTQHAKGHGHGHLQGPAKSIMFHVSFLICGVSPKIIKRREAEAKTNKTRYLSLTKVDLYSFGHLEPPRIL